MRYLNSKQLKELYRRLKFRRWINVQLQQAGGDEYLKRLEADIGVEPGHFRRELNKGLLPDRKNEDREGAAGLAKDLPPILTALRKV